MNKSLVVLTGLLLSCAFLATPSLAEWDQECADFVNDGGCIPATAGVWGRCCFPTPAGRHQFGVSTALPAVRTPGLLILTPARGECSLSDAPVAPLRLIAESTPPSYNQPGC